MRGNLARTGIILASCLALMPVLARGAEISSARIWADRGHTRLVFDLSGPLHYQLNQQGGQLVLDIPAAVLSRGFSAPRAQGLFHGLSSTHQGDTLHLAAEVDPNSRPKSFLLEPSGNSGYRLVVDLLPGAANAPVLEKVDSQAVAATARAQNEAAVAEAAAEAAKSAPKLVSANGARPDNQRNNALYVHSPRQAAALMGGERKIIVAVDPGHGGKDPGSHGPNGTLEKDVTLAVARDLAAAINRQPGMQAILTRDSDIFIPLERRYQIARDNSADMFVSVHADAYTSGDARGSSVWVLSARGKTNEAARMLADRENRVDLIGGVSLDDKNDNLASVLLDMQQGYAMQASSSIAQNVFTALASLGPTHRNYVESANFVVLRSPDVPSILVETAFISNPQEERKLRDPEHQQQLAQAVMGGIRHYFETTPPQGTWFAAQALRRRGGVYAAAVPVADGAVAPSKTGADPTQASVSQKARALADANVRDVHRVGRGESLRSIARQYNVSVGELKTANNLSSDNAVRVGMVLTIPAG